MHLLSQCFLTPVHISEPPFPWSPNLNTVFVWKSLLNLTFMNLLLNLQLSLTNHYVISVVLSKRLLTRWLNTGLWELIYKVQYPMLNNSETYLLYQGVHRHTHILKYRKPEQLPPLTLSMSTIIHWLLISDFLDIMVYCIYFCAYLHNNEILFPFIFTLFTSPINTNPINTF